MAGCINHKIAKEFLIVNDWPVKLSEPRLDRCYCETCYPSNLKDTYVVGGKTYVVPRGYTRIGVRIDEVYAEHLNIWKSWANCYHGTSIKSAKSIIEHRSLLLPGEQKMDGKEIAIRPGHISGENFFFTTPAINYASLSTYATSYDFKSSNDKKDYYVTVVLQYKQKPDSFTVQRETVGAGRKRICPFIKNEEIEWKSKQRSSIIPYGILLRVERVKSRFETMSRRSSVLSAMKYADAELKYKDMEWQQVECPHCYHLSDWINPKENQGVVITCELKSCKASFEPFNCPYCTTLFTYCSCLNRFNKDTVFSCDNSKCGKSLISNKCPHCPDGFNLCKEPGANQTVSVTCSTETCKKKYSIFYCPHCSAWIDRKCIVVGKKGVVITCTSRSCSKTFQLSECSNCLNVNVCQKVCFRAGCNDVVTCAYKGCGIKFKQPVQPRH